MEITGLLFRQMLVLFAMMAAGYLAFRRGIFGKTGQKEISALIVRILNPFLMISSILTNAGDAKGTVILQNVVMVSLYYTLLIGVSFLYVRLRRFSLRGRCLQQLMLVLSNIGFLGIPVVRAVYGPQYVLYVVFYMLFFNVIAYTYGVYLASGLAGEEGDVSETSGEKRSGRKPASDVRPSKSPVSGSLPEVQRSKSAGSGSISEVQRSNSRGNGSLPEVQRSKSPGSGSLPEIQRSNSPGSGSHPEVHGSKSSAGRRLGPGRIVNVGTVSSLIAILLFIFQPPVPEAIRDFCTYMGNACIPLSMILIGGSLAQLPLGEIFRDPENYIFTAVKMLLIPAAGILILRGLPFAGEVKSVFYLMLSMPVASLAGMLAEEYGRSGNEVNKVTAMTTLVSVLTIPLLSFLY